jgi:hypothetical protein
MISNKSEVPVGASGREFAPEDTLTSSPNQGQLGSQPKSQSVRDHSRCVLCRTVLREPSLVKSLPAPLDEGLRRFPLVLGFVLEIHTLLHRMSLRYKLRFASYFLNISPEEMAECQTPNTRTHSYMRDMRSFVERHPWATILDLETYRDAWLAGAEWGSDKTCTRGQET